MTSTSSGGNSVIVLQFSLSLSIDVAEQEVQSAINAAQSFLPVESARAADLQQDQSRRCADPHAGHHLRIPCRLSQVEDLVDTRLAPKISQLTGVGLVSISGGQKPAVRIQANPGALSSYGINLEDLRTRSSQASVNAAKGNFDGPRQDYQIDANDQLVSQRRLHARRRRLPQRRARACCKDVANVVDGIENNNQAAWMNQTPAVIVNIQRQPGANTISVVNSIKQLLPQLEANLPAGIKVTTLTDRTTGIHASVADVEFELMLTIVLVVLVIFLFLRNLSATIIPSVAVPLSLVGTFGVMYVLGYSLNNLSLMALTISTGFVVDDAIVMIENISRLHRRGRDAYGGGAARARNRSASPFISLTVSLIAVLIPLLFMGDVVGRLFREFAVTLAVTILISAVVSLTLTPMMCCAHPAPRPRGPAGTLLPRFRARLRSHDRLLRAHPEGGAALPDDHPAGGGRHPGADRFSLHHHSQGLLPGAGHRRDPGHLAGARNPSPSRPWPNAAGTGQGDSARIRRWRASPPSSGRTAPTPRSTAAASRST